MSIGDYKQRQIEHEDFQLTRYNLRPIALKPVEQYYAEREYVHGLKLLHRLLSPEQMSTMLVAGVGAGPDVHYWLTHMPLTKAVGLDFSIEALKATQRRIDINQLPNTFRFLRGDFEHIPLADNVVDVGTFVHALHHAQNPELGFKELWRVSRAVLLIEPMSTPVTRLFVRLGIAQDVEDVGNKVIRFKLQQYLDWAGDECAAYIGESHLFYYHPVIYRHILPVFNSYLGVSLLKWLYVAANAALVPIHSRLVAVLVKRL